MIDSGKKNLLGVMIDAVDYEAAVHRILAAAKNGQRHTVTALAVHGVMTGVSSPEHRYRLNHFDMVVPDGQPVRWGVNSLHGTGLKDRVYGPNLMLHVCRQAAQESIPIYLFGATEEILGLLEENLCKKFPGLRIVGKKPSAFRTLSAEEFEQLADEIRNSGQKSPLLVSDAPDKRSGLMKWGISSGCRFLRSVQPLHFTQDDCRKLRDGCKTEDSSGSIDCTVNLCDYGNGTHC